ncbi:MAG TPA: hypothetical protein VLA52_15390, partial [Thermohalobaculum sp.]|nr:hypothetical protein [Thermohalobaculum sp.]
HITGGAEAETFQPMNVNFGLFPPLEAEIRQGRKGKRDRARAYTGRAKASLQGWVGDLGYADIGSSNAGRSEKVQT